ncbi:hypothetical protein VNI00_004612 [Paramarasmius palmivorus]|uniref:Aminoglycoside phosphotransferase domain-containing protein n=1 Tax=Paramarasmius palmivorus TaxID=297713 RepID=A0AAW0DIB6_9AGAR
MPTLIRSLSKAVALKEAQVVASSYYTSQPVSARMHEDQGMFSCTVVVTLADDTEVIVQLKDNEVDLTKVTLARTLLGDVVPDMHGGKCTKAYFAYLSELIPGRIWSEKELSLEEDVSVASQVARLLSKCSLGIDSSGIVDLYLLPRLRKILEKEDVSDDAIRTRIEKLCDQADQVKKLPLSLCHIDINARNIILNENAHVVGLVDWEQACLLPLGMNAWCIRYLSVPIIGGKDRPTEKTQAMAEAFWKNFTANMSVDAQRAVIIAMQIGFVLWSVYFETSSPSSNNLVQFVGRFDWFESVFGPLCGVVS